MDSSALNNLVAAFLVLKESNPSKLSTTLTEKKNEVFESFGGITNMVQLCLTHPNVSHYIDTKSQRFQQLEQIIVSNKTTDNTESTKDHDSASACPIATRLNVSNADDVNKQFKCDQKTKKTLISLDNQIVQTVNNATQYEDSKLIIDCDPKYNLLFRWIENENVASSWYKLILNVKFITLLIFVVSVCIVVIWIHVYFKLLRTANLICKMIVSSVMICYCISLLLIANITLVNLIKSTFDFWFKLYNIVILMAAIWIRAHETTRVMNGNVIWSNKFEFAADVIMQIAVVLASIVLFLADAVPLSTNIKRGLIGLYGIVFLNQIVYIYFFRPDFEWNPLEKQYTQISFKSIIISSEINLILFVVKPVFSDMIRHLKRYVSAKMDLVHACLCSNSNSIDSDIKSKDKTIGNINTRKYQRCGTVYKRPYLRWSAFSVSSELTFENIVSK